MADESTVGDVTLSTHGGTEAGLNGRAPIAPKRKVTPAKLIRREQHNSHNGVVAIAVALPGGENGLSTQYEEFEVDLVKGSKGLGFSIACRLPDNTDVFPNCELIPSAGPLRIYVRELLADGVAAVDGRIQPGDCILKVNKFDLLNVPYTTAANILKSTMGSVRLLMARKKSFDHVEAAIEMKRPADDASNFDTSSSAKSSSAAVSDSEVVTSTATLGDSTEVMTSSLTVGEDTEIVTSSRITVNDSDVITSDVTVGHGSRNLTSFVADDNNPRTEASIYEITRRSPVDNIATESNTDINGNDKCDGKQLIHTESDTLQRRLNEAKQKRIQLSEQLKQVHSQIAELGPAVVKGDEEMERKLVDAESASHQAQRNMIALQTSLSASQAEFIALESNLRQQIVELQLKYQHIENTVGTYRSRDDEYAALREKARERHMSRETRYEKQLNVLNDKLQRLKAGGTNSGSSPGFRLNESSDDVVTLVSHIHHSRADVLDLPVVISIPRPPDDSATVDERIGRFSSGHIIVPSIKDAGLDTVDNWSVMDQRLDDEPPSYPPPPVPDDYDSELERDVIASSSRSTLAVPDQPTMKTVQLLRDDGSERSSVGSGADGGSFGSRRSARPSDRRSPVGQSLDSSPATMQVAATSSGSDAILNTSGTHSSTSGTLERQRKKEAKQRNSASGSGSSMQPFDRLRRMFGSSKSVSREDEEYGIEGEHIMQNESNNMKTSRQSDRLPSTMTSSVGDLNKSKKTSGLGKKFKLSFGGRKDKGEDMSASTEMTWQSTMSIDAAVASFTNEQYVGDRGEIVEGGSSLKNGDNTNGRLSAHLDSDFQQNNDQSGNFNTKETGSSSTGTFFGNRDQRNGTWNSDLNPGLADRWTPEEVYQWLLAGPANTQGGAVKLKAFNIDGFHLMKLNTSALKGLGLDSKERDHVKKSVKDLQTAVNREKKQQEKMRKKS